MCSGGMLGSSPVSRDSLNASYLLPPGCHIGRSRVLGTACMGGAASRSAFAYARRSVRRAVNSTMASRILSSSFRTSEDGFLYPIAACSI